MAPQSHTANRKPLHSLRECSDSQKTGFAIFFSGGTAQRRRSFIPDSYILDLSSQVRQKFGHSTPISRESTGQMGKALAESQEPERRKRVLLESNSPRDLRSKTRRIDRFSQILKKLTLDLSRLSASSRTPLAACSLMSSESGCSYKCVRASDKSRVWHRPYRDTRRDRVSHA